MTRIANVYYLFRDKDKSFGTRVIAKWYNGDKTI